MVGRIPASYHRGSEYDMAKQSAKKQPKLSLKEKREVKRTKAEQSSPRGRKDP